MACPIDKRAALTDESVCPTRVGKASQACGAGAEPAHEVVRARLQGV